MSTRHVEQDDQWPIEGEVADPMTEEEAEAALLAWWAEHQPPATDEEVAEATRQLDIAERMQREIAERIRRLRSAHAGQS